MIRVRVPDYRASARCWLLGGLFFLVSTVVAPQAAYAAAYPHGPHNDAATPHYVGSCTGWASHYVPQDGYVGYANTARYSANPCYQLEARHRCYTIYGVVIDSGVAKTAPGSGATAITVYLDACNKLYQSGHSIWASASSGVGWSFAT